MEDGLDDTGRESLSISLVVTSRSICYNDRSRLRGRVNVRCISHRSTSAHIYAIAIVLTRTLDKRIRHRSTTPARGMITFIAKSMLITRASRRAIYTCPLSRAREQQFTGDSFSRSREFNALAPGKTDRSSVSAIGNSRGFVRSTSDTGTATETADTWVKNTSRIYRFFTASSSFAAIQGPGKPVVNVALR